VFGLFMACGGDGQVPVRRMPTAEDMLKENRAAVKLEEHDMDLFAQRMGVPLKTTARGVRYHFIRDVEGPTARPDQWAKVNYAIALINGDPVYRSEAGRPESFLVEMDQVESGLHEAIQLMSPGDSALVVIPSYRAYGLIGDQDKIPMRSTVIYHIGLVAATSSR
jgi:FKBP-type peptidyl-prolyl cis-trans isomerase